MTEPVIDAILVGESQTGPGTRSSGSACLIQCPPWAARWARRSGKKKLVMMSYYDFSWSGWELRNVPDAVRAEYVSVLGEGQAPSSCLGCALLQDGARDRRSTQHSCSGVLDLCAVIHNDVCGTCRATACAQRMHLALLRGPRVPIGSMVKVVAAVDTLNDGTASDDEAEFREDWERGEDDDLVRTLRTDAGSLLRAYVQAGEWPVRGATGQMPQPGIRWLRLAPTRPL